MTMSNLPTPSQASQLPQKQYLIHLRQSHTKPVGAGLPAKPSQLDTAVELAASFKPQAARRSAATFLLQLAA
jgi:hypothetical protein